MPALMCTTVPPAKSIAPHWKTRPASAIDLVEIGLRGGLGGGVGRSRERLGGGVDRVGAGPVPDHVRDREVDERHPQRMNSARAENFMRSAKAPTISAGVITANVIWKQT